MYTTYSIIEFVKGIDCMPVSLCQSWQSNWHTPCCTCTHNRPTSVGSCTMSCLLNETFTILIRLLFVLLLHSLSDCSSYVRLGLINGRCFQYSLCLSDLCFLSLQITTTGILVQHSSCSIYRSYVKVDRIDLSAFW